MSAMSPCLEPMQGRPSTTGSPEAPCPPRRRSTSHSARFPVLADRLTGDARIHNGQNGDHAGHTAEGVAEDDRIPTGVAPKHVAQGQDRGLRTRNVSPSVRVTPPLSHW